MDGGSDLFYKLHPLTIRKKRYLVDTFFYKFTFLELTIYDDHNYPE